MRFRVLAFFKLVAATGLAIGACLIAPQTVNAQSILATPTNPVTSPLPVGGNPNDPCGLSAPYGYMGRDDVTFSAVVDGPAGVATNAEFLVVPSDGSRPFDIVVQGGGGFPIRFQMTLRREDFNSGVTYAWMVRATDGNGDATPYTQACHFISLYGNGIPAITSYGQATFVAGVQNSFTVTATGSPAPTFSEVGPLPAGVSLSTDGVLAGTPPAGTEGSYPIQLFANGDDYSTQNFTLNVTRQGAPAITSDSQATFDIGVPGSFTVTATGSPTPTFSESGALPTGVTFSSVGVLSGTPTAGTAGFYPITITATNSNGNATQLFTLSVTAPPAPPALAVGVEGTDGQLWVQAPQLSSGWQPLGGRIIAPPAVAAPPNPGGTTPADPLFIGTGTDGTLWLRSATDGWQPIGAAQCIGGPAAIITGSTLTLACRGTDNALWYNTATLPSSGLPMFPAAGWTSLGGVLSAGPAVAPVSGTVTFFVRGTSGAIYTRTVAADYAVTPWFCAGQPAAAQQAATGTTTFACNAGGALWDSANTGSGWSPAVSLGGALLGGPAVAATSLQTDFLAEGTDHAVWELTPAGLASLGGGVIGGVGATALS